MANDSCSEPGCVNKPYAHGMCRKHRRESGIPARRTGFQRSELTDVERFMAKVIVLDDGCWEWQGQTWKGHGRFHNGETGTMMAAHRWSYEHHVGPIDEGLVLDHTCHTNDPTCNDGVDCRHRRCVNPAHLEPVDSPENTRRGNGPTAVNAAKTECVNGHPFDEKNTYVRANGKRQCRTCQAAAAARHKERSRSA